MITPTEPATALHRSPLMMTRASSRPLMMTRAGGMMKGCNMALVQRPMRCHCSGQYWREDSLSIEPFIMQRLIIILRPPTPPRSALTYRFPKCQEEPSSAVDPRAAPLAALLLALL
ncbi:hypothetical protein MHYP_G00067180 [Metynnis hypsauchen]